MHAKLAAAFEPLLRDGVLGPGTLPVNEESSRVLSVRNVGEPRTAARLVPRDRVVPERIIKPDGPVAPGIQGGLHHPAGRPDSLRAGRRENSIRSSTLTYEADATARLRDEASSRVHDVYDTYSRGEVLVEAGQTIGEEQLILLRLEHEAAMGELSFGDKARRAWESWPWSRRSTSWRQLTSSGASRGSSKTIAASP